MIKHINPQNVTTTPFVAAKARALYNIQNEDAVMAEPSVYPGGTLIALDYVDYNSGDPTLNNDCNIALEQQSFDTLDYEEGITGSGKFDPETDPQNSDGTYKSLVHRTIKNTFYNTYRNPTEIFGVEHIDFPLSKTLRNLSDKFRMFNVPPSMFGEKIQPNSVRFNDNLFDDNVTVVDDGYQNLIAGYNLFSKVQEVRVYSSGSNQYYDGPAGSICPSYGQIFLTSPNPVSVYIGDTVEFEVSASGTPRPIYYQWYSGSYALTDGGNISGSTGPVLYISNVQISNTGSYRVFVYNSETGITSSWAGLDVKQGVLAVTVKDIITTNVNLRFGSTQTSPPYLEQTIPSFGTTLLSGSVVQTVQTMSIGQDTASLSYGFRSGYIFDSVIRPSFVPTDTASVSLGFAQGRLFNAMITTSLNQDGFAAQSAFSSGYISTIVNVAPATEGFASFAVTLLSGSVH